MIRLDIDRQQKGSGMARNVFLVFSEPVPGHEDAYHEWYTGTHLAEVAATEGFVAAQRFRLCDLADAALAPQRFLAIYEFEGDPEQAEAALAAGQPARVSVPDAMAPSRSRWWFEAISERVESAS
jgi:hypothetical protein